MSEDSLKNRIIGVLETTPTFLCNSTLEDLFVFAIQAGNGGPCPKPERLRQEAGIAAWFGVLADEIIVRAFRGDAQSAGVVLLADAIPRVIDALNRVGEIALAESLQKAAKTIRD